MNEKERAIMNLLVEAHNQYMLLEPTHPDDRRDWCDALHNVQDILNRRILRRDYPKDFATYPDTIGKVNKVNEGKTELTYLEFIKLFEGGEEEKNVNYYDSANRFIQSILDSDWLLDSEQQTKLTDLYINHRISEGF